MAQSSKTRQRAQERRAQRRRQQQIRIMIAVGAGAIILAGILILVSLQPTPEVAESATDYAGLDQSVDESRGVPGYALGSSDAPVTLEEYSDFSCSHCRDLAPLVQQLIDEYVRDGRLRIVYRPVSFVNPSTSELASRAMICAAEQSQAWEMQSQIWAISDANGPGAYTKALLSAQAETLGLDRSQFNQCYDSAETRGTAQAVNVEADARGVQGTPTLFVNGVNVPYRGADAAYQDMVRAIESALGG